ncbi:complement component 1 Q subcomponent-binding protein, mitochondrial [Eurytemora carolleeae]|uniref:complement component 1 Q subcomponent-binding protein, mitochondrial n=1 Tax=Eurytemora carolleeae TaxID=1294199 RepID=UPI000C76799E|nr:complement component 1 Q subcomponent-binding protein, mitochondrial [Eurytemora carolleeae]|eukprot:XP_023331539.1 complement component 1 Q subcomponent-binding protein, mitochondrial-like [Eurytemora affinis]
MLTNLFYRIISSKMSKSRSLVNLASKLVTANSRSVSNFTNPRLLSSVLRTPTQFSCVVPARAFATKGDAEIVKFLAEEIASEKQNQKPLTKLEGWEVKIEGAEVTLTKSAQGEKIIVSLNVNHTVDSAEPDDGTGEAPEMMSRPNFEVDIVKSNGKTLSFTCTYVHPEEMAQEGEGPEDLFAIEEVTMYEGDKISDKNYAVAGDILDGYLYDLFMQMLEERGVNSEFADNLSEWCSAHEHSQYINLLQEIEKFAKM